MVGNPILAAVDGSASSYHAVAWAAVEATRHRSPLHILTSMAIPTGFGPGMSLGEADLELLRGDGERILDEATRVARTAAPAAEPGITSEVTFESIIPTLIERSQHTRMLVVGSRGLGAFQRGLLGSVSTATTQHARCPVAVIHGTAAIDAVWATKPILVGVDGTDNSALAIELAFEEASLRGVGVVALHAWSDVTGLDLPIGDWADLHRQEQVVLAESLAGYSDKYPDVPVHRIVVVDRPVRSLLEESANAQLVVVGSHGRGGFASMILGSTSNALLHSVEIPLIIVRSK
ncbi:universal stress protein [Nocardia sp. NBC_00508]|uniref:universal stress protein n=1 Tax=Nocardia sp. NBC_00508 TaxID=2975992 RepID=UPI002E801729|nr:universal stress protein [Nocardia sp. NBC_00508]WUD66028.1 universal stress protein [Nocardia sp. NBC_00508]